ncbi:MAG TPA: hypothetical protein VN914_01800 [Polyangia bacterium]|nr:hypothetical protein [Polyangia bacterium]
MRSRTLLFLALSTLAACQGSDPADDAPLCAADTTKGAPVAKMAGTWTGSGTFGQTWNGKTASVPVKLNLELDEQGVPGTLPALGMISPWHAYPGGGPGSLRGVLEAGGAAFAYCSMEADGSANLINLAPRSRCGSDSAVEWSYEASYRFADLLEYQLYDYDQPGAPQVRVEATDSFQLTTTGGKETLIVRGRAVGATIDGKQPIELRVDAQLTRGEANYDSGCRLGPRPL